MIITHGRAKRRMVGFALGVGAVSARARIPDLIADAFRGEPTGSTETADGAATSAAAAESPIDDVPADQPAPPPQTVEADR